MKTRKQIPTVLVTAALLAQLALPAADAPVPRSNGKPADMTKKVKVFILLGQSNMVGLGKVKGGEGSLENAVKTKKKYPCLVDEAGNWVERQDVRFVRYMSGRGPLNNEWMTVAKCGTIGPEFGLAHVVGDAIDAPVLILKCCIGNRSLGWDLLPPGSERYEFVIKAMRKEFSAPDAKFVLGTMGESVKGSGGNGGKAEVYMDVGEAMGQAMVELLKNK